jgi:hypothetical protein
MPAPAAAAQDGGTRGSSSSTMAQFALHAQDGLARLGKLVTKHGTISTPASLLYTRRGSSLFLTPDMLQRLKPLAEAVQINAIQFLENPDAATMASSGAGAREFLALQGFPIIATNRDPSYYEYGGRPSTAVGVHAMLPSGGMLVTPDRYMSTIKALQLDAYVAICDEIPGDAKLKKAAQSVDRTARWLAECVALHRELGVEAALLAPITGEAGAARQPICCIACQPRRVTDRAWRCLWRGARSRPAAAELMRARRRQRGTLDAQAPLVPPSRPPTPPPALRQAPATPASGPGRRARRPGTRRRRASLCAALAPARPGSSRRQPSQQRWRSCRPTSPASSAAWWAPARQLAELRQPRPAPPPPRATAALASQPTCLRRR